MGNIPVLKPIEIVAILNHLGFNEVRQRGSHKQFRHQDGRGTTVPFHAGRDVSPKRFFKRISIIHPHRLFQSHFRSRTLAQTSAL